MGPRIHVRQDQRVLQYTQAAQAAHPTTHSGTAAEEQSTMAKQIATVSTTIKLNDIERLRELNKNMRIAQREYKGKTLTLTLTGTFPVVKRWNAEQVKKEVVENGHTFTDAEILDIGVKWIETKVDGVTYYVKATETPSEDAFVRYTVKE